MIKIYRLLLRDRVTTGKLTYLGLSSSHRYLYQAAFTEEELVIFKLQHDNVIVYKWNENIKSFGEYCD